MEDRDGRAVRLTRAPGGVEDFGVVGVVDGEPCKATWDGFALVLTERLYQRVLLAIAVDEIYVEAGIVASHHRATLEGNACDVVLTLARCCDVLRSVEYTFAGRHRSSS